MCDDRDRIIARECAFKGAIEALMRCPIVPEDLEALSALVLVLTDRFEEIIWSGNGQPKAAAEKPALVQSKKVNAPKEAGEKHYCDTCGKLKVYKEGISKKNGDKWRALMCPDRDCKGKPTWLKDRPEGLEEDSDEPVPFE